MNEHNSEWTPIPIGTIRNVHQRTPLQMETSLNGQYPEKNPNPEWTPSRIAQF